MHTHFTATTQVNLCYMVFTCTTGCILVTLGGKTKSLFDSTHSLQHLCQKFYWHRLICIEVIVCNISTVFRHTVIYHNRLQCFDAVGWVAGRVSGLQKTERWGAGVVICLERVADLHMDQLMPLPLIVSCFSKIQIGFTFLLPAYPGSPGQRAVKRVCVCVCVSCNKLPFVRLHCHLWENEKV